MYTVLNGEELPLKFHLFYYKKNSLAIHVLFKDEKTTNKQKNSHKCIEKKTNKENK